MGAAEEHGAELRIGCVEEILREGVGGRAVGACVDGEALHADAVVIAMGPWSIQAAAWLPLPPTYGLKGHSLICETGALAARALF